MAKMVSLTKQELLAFLNEAYKANKMHWLMFLTAFSHGLRVTEVIKLKAKQIQDGYITVQRLKGSLKTTQPLVVNADPLLNEKPWLEGLVLRLKDDDLLFNISRIHAWRLMQKYGALAGIPKHKCHPHALKHSIAKQNIKSAGVENIRQYLGHKSLSSTGEYLKVTDDEASEAIAASMGAKL